MASNKVLLMILDGYGLREEKENNATKQADTPYINKLFNERPNTALHCFGPAVGLPEGVMGNSEVGHLNIGAGRVVEQDLMRINRAFENDMYEEAPVFNDLVEQALKNDKPVHLLGLMSDAGVHSDYRHLMKLLKKLKEAGVKQAYVHALMDGRDTPPKSGAGYVRKLLDFMQEIGFGKISTVVGRYYGMDRDKRWDRIERAYRAMVHGEGHKTDDPVKAIRDHYDKKITDEFMEPIVVGDEGRIEKGDSVLAFNFRADRMREIAIALNDKDFDEFGTEDLDLNYYTMTEYQAEFPYPVLFPPEQLTNIFGEVISKAGLRQLRIAETEKYAHVTYFLNGGEEKQYKGEDRIMVPSPKVATYDLQPEMSAPEVTEKLLEAIQSEKHDAIILNFANGDMVGHTGDLKAAVQALEYLDGAVEKIVKAFTEKGGTVLVTADHGNCEEMWDAGNDQAHTQHTLNKVPFIVVEKKNTIRKLRDEGKLSDIAPTMLQILGVDQPGEMSGKSLISDKK
ncbi:MAG: 2,3-bisphosphoglycerate-independent phosphoglycerate mutase [Candidatus Marinimicrobia bacterium]|nr:2,3-bisphosphoglycerate-independent phosphoglycerate mutase [Candidatus Neomarinimicrobiota bacterium]